MKKNNKIIRAMLTDGTMKVIVNYKLLGDKERRNKTFKYLQSCSRKAGCTLHRIKE